MDKLPFAKKIKPKRTLATRSWEWQKKQTNKAIKRINAGKKFRASIRQRDRMMCCLCGGLENLHVHHISNRFGKREFDERNCITLCDKHHRGIHNNIKYWRPILKEFICRIYGEVK